MDELPQHSMSAHVSQVHELGVIQNILPANPTLPVNTPVSLLPSTQVPVLQSELPSSMLFCSFPVHQT